MNNNKVTNVALSGPYGAGKSSVISTYLSQHPKCNALNISIATFDGYTLEKIAELKENDNDYEDQEYANKLQDELERGILKQLFYKVDSDKIPLSRYRKLHDISLFRYILFVFALCVITSRFRLKEISVGDTTVQGETESTESILNKNMDEILYFFERTKYDVVFIEDLGRFNDTSIFIKLREINVILNNYDAIRRKKGVLYLFIQLKMIYLVTKLSEQSFLILLYE